MLQQEAAPSTAPAAAHIPGISSNDAAPEVTKYPGNAEAIVQGDDRGKIHAVVGQQPSMAVSNTSLKVPSNVSSPIFTDMYASYAQISSTEVLRNRASEFAAYAYIIRSGFCRQARIHFKSSVVLVEVG